MREDLTWSRTRYSERDDFWVVNAPGNVFAGIVRQHDEAIRFAAELDARRTALLRFANSPMRSDQGALRDLIDLALRTAVLPNDPALPDHPETKALTRLLNHGGVPCGAAQVTLWLSWHHFDPAVASEHVVRILSEYWWRGTYLAQTRAGTPVHLRASPSS